MKVECWALSVESSAFESIFHPPRQQNHDPGQGHPGENIDHIVITEIDGRADQSRHNRQIYPEKNPLETINQPERDQGNLGMSGRKTVPGATLHAVDNIVKLIPDEKSLEWDGVVNGEAGTNSRNHKIAQIREDITEKLKEFVDNPRVSVIVLQANSMKIFVQGEVARPGVYQLGSDTTLLHAISLAGGFNEWAKKKKIIIMREAGGKTLRITVDYEKIIADKKMNQNIVLERGDTIIVP